MSINRILADLGKAVDSSSTGNFLNKEASGAEFNPVQWSDINSAPTILDSALASAIIDSAYVQARQTGVGSGGLDSATTIALIDSDYVGARASTGGSGFTKYQYTATASQTTFQDSDANGNVLSYDADYILVHYNGVLLPSADYTATDGSSVVLGTGADSGSIIGIAKWGAAAGSSSGSGAVWYGDRAVIGGGVGVSQFNTIDYFNLTTSGNATDFGDRTVAKSGLVGTSDGTYATFTGHGTVIDKVTISTTGNATEIGLLSDDNHRFAAGIGDGTYGYVIGGTYNTWTTNVDRWSMTTSGNASSVGDVTNYNAGFGAWGNTERTLLTGGKYASTYRAIEYFTLSNSISGTTTFGNLSPGATDRNYCYVTGDLTRAVMGGGVGSSRVNVIDYVTIASTGNATDFGDLTASLQEHCATSNATYAVWTGGNDGAYNAVINYVTIQTTGNATDHGDLTLARQSPGATSGSPS